MKLLLKKLFFILPVAFAAPLSSDFNATVNGSSTTVSAIATSVSHPTKVDHQPAFAKLVDVELVPTTTYLLYTTNLPSYTYVSEEEVLFTSKVDALVSDYVAPTTTLTNPIDTSTITQGVKLVGLDGLNISRSYFGDNSSVSPSLSSQNETSTKTIDNLGKRASSNANGFSGDLFQAISTNALSSKFKEQQLPLSIPSGVSNTVPYQTNKFYVNLFLGDQTKMIWSYPFGLQWSTSSYYGLGVQHTITSNRVFGQGSGGTASYFYNPTGVKELVISATQLTSSSNKLTVSNMKVMSANVKLSTDGQVSSNYIEIPIVQGMGLVTSIYHGSMTPLINTAVGFTKFVSETSSNLNSNVIKYRATLSNGTQYLIYVILPSGYSKSSFQLSASGSNALKGSTSINGLIIQMAVAPLLTSQDVYYDQSVGKYATEAKVKAHGYGGTTATYTFSYNTVGTSKSGQPLVFTLPHQVASFTSDTQKANTGITLASTTKGNMVGLLTSEVNMSETLHPEIQFLPWLQELGTGSISYNASQLQLLASVANSELSVNIPNAVTLQTSMYYAGKTLDKYAYILLVVNDILGQTSLAQSTLASMKQAIGTYISNTQSYYPLMHDTKFGGVTSTASQSGDYSADFGSALYNDHHFHYGYFIHAAAVIGYLDNKIGDGTWIKTNQFWVNSLIRDVSNPSPDDPYFPVFRMFDWFAGHSWAGGLTVGGNPDGRDEESSSEDYNYSYAIKLWGRVSGNQRMEQIGDLMLAVIKRSMNSYFLYTLTNTIEPSNYIANKVSGTLWDNKIAYTTYFGSNVEYIHGIHMLPITPASSLIRGLAYVKEEWNSILASIVNNLTTGWLGILRLNQALFDPKSSYRFFSSSSFSSLYLDNGQSRTWSLAFSGGLVNVL